MVATKQRGAAGAAIDGINKTINSMTNYYNFLIVYWFPKAEMTEE
jgi:hypothetical protein